MRKFILLASFAIMTVSIQGGMPFERFDENLGKTISYEVKCDTTQVQPMPSNSYGSTSDDLYDTCVNGKIEAIRWILGLKDRDGNSAGC